MIRTTKEEQALMEKVQRVVGLTLEAVKLNSSDVCPAETNDVYIGSPLAREIFQLFAVQAGLYSTRPEAPDIMPEKKQWDILIGETAYRAGEGWFFQDEADDWYGPFQTRQLAQGAAKEHQAQFEEYLADESDFPRPRGAQPR